MRFEFPVFLMIGPIFFASCGGDEFSPGPAGAAAGAGGATAGAGGAAAGAGGTAAGAGGVAGGAGGSGPTGCAAKTGSWFCDDFDTSGLTKWDEVTQNSGEVKASAAANAISAPNVL